MPTTKLFTGDLSKVFDMQDFIDNSSGDIDFTIKYNHKFFSSYYPDAPLSRMEIDEKGNFKAHFNFVVKMKMSPKDRNSNNWETARSIFSTMNVEGYLRTVNGL